MEWIDSKKQEPPKDVRFIALLDNDCVQAVIFDTCDNRYHSTWDGDVVGKIHFWMIIPPSPEVK